MKFHGLFLIVGAVIAVYLGLDAWDLYQRRDEDSALFTALSGLFAFLAGCAFTFEKKKKHNSPVEIEYGSDDD